MTSGRTVLDDVRDALDDDLDTPAAVRMVDDAAQRGFDVRDAASLLGVLM
jgi:cysteinyl-tRNA synthetase